MLQTCSSGTFRRFRTYYPDAYKKHYPNARTHLSSKVRSVLPDGTSLFVKTRGKRRRPFSEEEDRALKAGYEKHGTTWATIVKDPIFREQNRRSTDLRDRFRNAFPNLYQAAGYKPRSNKKKLDGPIRAATDDQLSMSTTIGPIRPRRRAQTSQGLLRGGTKSVPQSTACSEDEDSSGAEDEAESLYVFKTPPTPVTLSSLPSRRKKSTTKDVSILDDDDDEMASLYPLTDPLNIPDFLPSETHSDMETWSSGINTPTHSSHAWSTAAVSPASSSNVSDYLMNSSSQSSPFLQRPLSEFLGDTNNNNMIGKSAWGAHDWFSSNPRLDNSAGTASSSNSSSSFFGEGLSSPASPYSYHPHGVVDRYDLFPSSIPNHVSSEMGLGDSAGVGATYFGFGSEETPSGFKGYHSQIAGDLISGARTHQQIPNGFYGFGDISGLGLSGVSHHQQHHQQQQTGSIHPMQLHTPSLLGIDELGLTGITLNDQVDPVVSSSSTAMNDRTADGVLDLAVFNSPAGLQNHQQQQQQQEQKKNEPDESSSMLSDRFSLDDLVDMSGELHMTPPATPLIQPRPHRRSSGSILHHYSDVGHARSTSVPPSDVRNGTEQSSSFTEMHNHLGQSFFSHPHTPSRSTSHPRQRTSEPMRLSNSTGSVSMQSTLSTNLFSDHLMLVSPSSSSSGTSTNHGIDNIWRPGDNINDNKNGKTHGQGSPSPLLSSFMSNTISPGDFYNLPFLDLHYYGHTYGSGTSASSLGGHTPTMGSGIDLLHGTLGTAAEMARQGQALDLAQSAVLASSSTSTMGSTSGMLGLKHGSGLEGLLNALRQQSQHQPVTAMATRLGQRAACNLPIPLPSSTSSHPASPSPPPSPRTTPQPGPSLVLAPNGGMGTIRQSHVTNNHSSMGRSMSHHRGLSAVCPEDLVLRHDNNKRKRASWDGGAA